LRARDGILDVFDDIVRERKRQEVLHGEQSITGIGTDLYRAIAILGEEYGEVCKAALELDVVPFNEEGCWQLRAECIQVAAVACAMAERLDADGWT